MQRASIKGSGQKPGRGPAANLRVGGGAGSARPSLSRSAAKPKATGASAAAGSKASATPNGKRASTAAAGGAGGAASVTATLFASAHRPSHYHEPPSAPVPVVAAAAQATASDSEDDTHLQPPIARALQFDGVTAPMSRESTASAVSANGSDDFVYAEVAEPAPAPSRSGTAAVAAAEPQAIAAFVPAPAPAIAATTDASAGASANADADADPSAGASAVAASARAKLDALRARQDALRSRVLTAHTATIPAALGRGAALDHSARREQQRVWDDDLATRFAYHPVQPAVAAPVRAPAPTAAPVADADAVSIAIAPSPYRPAAAAAAVRSPPAAVAAAAAMRSPKSQTRAAIAESIAAAAAVIAASPLRAAVVSAADQQQPATTAIAASTGADVSDAERSDSDASHESGDDENDENTAPATATASDANTVAGLADVRLRTPTADGNALRLRPASASRGGVAATAGVDAGGIQLTFSPAKPLKAQPAVVITTLTSPASPHRSASKRKHLSAQKKTKADAYPPHADGSVDSAAGDARLPTHGFAIGSAAIAGAAVVDDRHAVRTSLDGVKSDIEMHIRDTAAAAREHDRHERHARAVALAAGGSGTGGASAGTMHGLGNSGGAGHHQNTMFGEFVESGKYPKVEDELIVKVDLLRRSNILNADPYDFALVINAHAYNNPMRLPGLLFPPAPARTAAERRRRKKQQAAAAAATATASGALSGANLHSIDEKAGAAVARAMPFGTPPPAKSGSGRSAAGGGVGGGSGMFSTPQPSNRKAKRAQKPVTVVGQIEERLRRAGLHVKREDSKVAGRHLLKLMAPPDRLELEAERMHLKMRLKRGGYCQFERSLRQHMAGVDERVLFRSSERQLIIEHILKSKVEDGGADLYGAERLGSAVELAFPLHMHARQHALHESWVKYWKQNSTSGGWSWLTALWSQPLDHVSNYFGEQIAFYFAWMGFYTKWLLVPVLLGVVLFCSQLAKTSIDGPVVPFYCLAMAIWATVFLECWKRENTRLAYGWGVLNYEKNDEYNRPEYDGTLRFNHHQHSSQLLQHEDGEVPDTPEAAAERSRVRWQRWGRTLGASLGLMAFLGGTCALMVYLFTSRDAYLSEHPSQDGVFGFDILFVPMVWGFIIPISDKLYLIAAKRLNAWENWRTESSDTSHLVVKVMSFRFMNSFLALYYYAFADLGITRLSVSLFSFMIAGQCVNYVFSIAVPWCWHKIKLWRAEALKEDLKTRNRRDSQIGRRLSTDLKREGLTDAWVESNKPEYENFEAYCDAVVQFAHVTLFSMAFPLAPLCALINNLVQIRADSYKLLNVCRRPMARRSGGIGVWMDVLQCVGVLAVLTNCAMIGFTSTQLQNWMPNLSSSDKLLAIFVFEHVLLGLKLIARALIPEVPTSIQRKMAREKVELTRAKTAILSADTDAHADADAAADAAAAVNTSAAAAALNASMSLGVGGGGGGGDDVSVGIERSPMRVV